MSSSLAERFEQLSADPRWCPELSLRKGSLKDYAGLCQHHYRSARPATAPRVLVLETPGVSVSGRWLGRTDERRTIGVLVESLPLLNCKLRDRAMGRRYGSIPAGRGRSWLLNQELRCISRVVVDPQYRGLGLSVRLVKAALADPATPLTEAIAAMGKVHPFFERAGMTPYQRPPHHFDARLTAALHTLGLDLAALARIHHTLEHINQQPITQKRWIERELLRWYRQTLGRSAEHSTDPLTHLKAARQRLLCEPVYYLHDNRPRKSASRSDAATHL